MLTQNQAKSITALQVKKYRHEQKKFVVEGEKMVGELLRQHKIKPLELFFTFDFAEKNHALLDKFSGEKNGVTESELKKISSLTTPNKVLAVAELPSELPDFQQLNKQFSFYLDGLQDPGNLGSILRIADWFGFANVFCSPDSVDAFNPKVVQACMGAIFRVNVFEMALEGILTKNPKLEVVGAVMDGSNVFQMSPPEAGILVIGNEARGISPTVEKLLTKRVSIPKDPAGGAESLNAAVASGILAAVLKNRV